MERLTEYEERYYGETSKTRQMCYMGFDGDCKYDTCCGCTILAMYRKLAQLEDLQEHGRLVILSEPMIPMVAGDDPMDSDVYCPRCEHDLSGGWREEHPDEWKLCQCPNCGQSIDDRMVVSRTEAQAALERMEGRE